MKRLDMKMARDIEASPVDITIDSGVTLLSMMSTCTNAKTYDCHRMRSGSSNFSGPTCSYSTKLHVYSTHTVAVTVSRTQVLVMVQQLPWWLDHVISRDHFQTTVQYSTEAGTEAIVVVKALGCVSWRAVKEVSAESNSSRWLVGCRSLLSNVDLTCGID